MGNREGAESSRALGMHTALWNHLAIEVRHLLKKPNVLEQRRTPFAGCCDVLVVVDGGAECGRKFFHTSPWVLHLSLLSVDLHLGKCHDTDTAISDNCGRSVPSILPRCLRSIQVGHGRV